MKLYRKNWKVQTVRSYSKKIVHDFCRGAQGSDFFFFSFFHTSRIPREVRPAGLRVLHLYVLLIDPCPAASSTCGDEKAAHGQRHGRGERAHAEYREWKPRAPLAGWNGAGTRNQGLHLPAANYPAWKKLRTEQPVPLTFLPSLPSSSPSSLIQLHPSRSLLVSGHYTEFLKEWIKIFLLWEEGLKWNLPPK